MKKMHIFVSYPKPPILDMKWKNRNINVVEWANIQKFSKLDNIGTPLILFELFFDNALTDMNIGYTKLYGHGEKADISFEIPNETFSLFEALYCLVGVINWKL